VSLIVLLLPGDPLGIAASSVDYDALCVQYALPRQLAATPKTEHQMCRSALISGLYQ
jgi:hypothetical protein